MVFYKKYLRVFDFDSEHLPVDYVRVFVCHIFLNIVDKDTVK